MNGNPMLIALLNHEVMDGPSRQVWRGLLRAALVPIGVTLVLLAVWSSSMPLAGAVVAPAEVKVELNRRTVQHQEGGIVREILVHDGQVVRAGDALAVIGNVRSDADLSLLQKQRSAEQILRARAMAEATLASRFEPPIETTADSQTPEVVARQQALFVARRRTLDEQIASLQRQVEDARLHVGALETQIVATDKSAKYANEELAINEQLVQQGFVQRTRLLALQRDASDYASRLGEQQGNRAAAKEHIGELESRIAQARNQYQSQATDEVKEATDRLREFDERLRAAQDTADRQVLRAPVDGEVMSLHATAIGQVLGPREPVADIVPRREKLVVEARIRPQDIDSVHVGGKADVRIDAFDTRRTPLLHGTVTFVSPDRITTQDGRDAWFIATIEVALDSRTADQPLQLRPGMPAEAFMTTRSRTLLQYLAKPLSQFSQRAMREP